MNTTPTFILAPRRVSRKRRQVPSTPPAALNLVSATYDSAVPSVILTFDRAIDIAGLDGSQIIVSDDVEVGLRYTATGASGQPSATTVEILLVDVGPATGPGITLTASATSGIVAVDDGGEWAGVSALELPFP